MNTILFATTNSRKVAEANAILTPLGLTVEPIALDIEEIQHHDSAEIAKEKARSAYDVAKRPIVVSDTCWSIPALGGFPGGYMKDVASWFTAQDWMALIGQYEDRTIECHEHVAYFDGEHLEYFVHAYKGVFVETPYPSSEKTNSIEQTVSLYGNKTMAELIDAGEIASAGEDLQHWQRFGEWFKNR